MNCQDQVSSYHFVFPFIDFVPSCSTLIDLQTNQDARNFQRLHSLTNQSASCSTSCPTSSNRRQLRRWRKDGISDDDDDDDDNDDDDGRTDDDGSNSMLKTMITV